MTDCQTMDLDDILGELSNLEEQLELQQEEFAKTALPISAKHNKTPSSDFGFSLSNDFLSSLNTITSSSSGGEVQSPTSPNRTTNGGISRNCSRSQDFLSRNPAELGVESSSDSTDRFDSARLGVGDYSDYSQTNSVRFDVNGGVRQGGVRQGGVRFGSNDGNGNMVSPSGSSTLPRNASLRLGSPEKRVSVGVASSCSSSRNSTQSFGSDWNDGGMMVGGLSNSGAASNGHSTMVNSYGTMSSQSSGSSGHSGSSPRRVLLSTIVKVYSPDGTSKSVGTGPQTTVGQLCEALMKKNLVVPGPSWTVLEQVRDLYMERMLEDHQNVSDVVDCWMKDSQNRLLFAEVPQKYDMFLNQEIVFDNDTYTPNVEGHLYLKLEGKKQWRKMYFVLRASGMYYSLKGKGKSPSDLTCLQTLRDVELFTAVNWRKIHKSPTDYGFALKAAMIQKTAPKYIKYLCTDDIDTLWRWITAIRLAKHGKKLLDNYKKARSYTSTRIIRSATTLGNTSCTVIGQMSQPISGKPRSGSLTYDSVDHGCVETNQVQREVGLKQPGGVADGVNGLRASMRTGRGVGNMNVGSLEELSDERTKETRDESFRASAVEKPCTEKTQKEPVREETERQIYNRAEQHNEHLYESRFVKEPARRTGSTDRLLDGSENYGTARRARSGSVDRLLDGDVRARIKNEEEEDDYEPDGWDDFDAGTIRRSSRYSSGTLGSRMGSLRRYSNALTPNKMVANIPITTNVTRQMSMQHDVRTLPRNARQPNDNDIDSTNQTLGRGQDGFATQRRDSQGSLSGASRLNSILSKAAARPASNASDRGGSLRWSLENSTSENDAVSQLGGERLIGDANSGSASRYTSPDKLNHIYSDIMAQSSEPLTQSRISRPDGASASMAFQPGLQHGASLEDLPPPPPPANVPGNLSHSGAKHGSGTDAFPPPTSRQRPASPNVLPPPPPEFLLAFPPSQSWSRVESGQGDHSFEESLDQQLEFLEDQVNQLSPRNNGGNRADIGPAKMSHTLQTGAELRNETIVGADGSRLGFGGSGENNLGAGTQIEARQNLGLDLASPETVSRDLYGRTSSVKASSPQLPLYACPSLLTGNTGAGIQQEHLYTSINIEQLENRAAATSEKLYDLSDTATYAAEKVGSNTDSGHFTDSSASVASSGYSTGKSRDRDISDHGYASIEEAVPSMLPLHISRPAEISQRTLPNTGSHPYPSSQRSATIPLKAASPKATHVFSQHHTEIPRVGSPPSSPPPDISLKVSVTGSIRRQKPPAPPRRSESTKLSTRGDDGNLPETSYFLRDLDRVICQKHEQGVNGLGNLEVPLPPPPPLILEDETLVNFVDLPPPPPADMLLGLRTMRRPPRVPPKPR